MHATDGQCKARKQLWLLHKTFPYIFTADIITILPSLLHTFAADWEDIISSLYTHSQCLFCRRLTEVYHLYCSIMEALFGYRFCVQSYKMFSLSSSYPTQFDFAVWWLPECLILCMWISSTFVKYKLASYIPGSHCSLDFKFADKAHHITSSIRPSVRLSVGRDGTNWGHLSQGSHIRLWTP